ncbi:MAG: NRDE family protein [Acetobacteraceae bacterium]|nr:NRDE family protein [Acetobacteraceae bacterium]
MCTLILLRRPGHRWPLIVAANRDERLERPWSAPARHWPARPGVIAGRDDAAGGTWMGLNDRGVLAAVLNRPHSLGPAPGKRSRGELPLLALEHPSAKAAAAALCALDAALWRPFNLVLADASGGWFLRGLGHGRPEARPLPPGLSIVTAQEPNDVSSPRIARALPRFAAHPPPDPEAGDWAGWEALLADSAPGEDRAAALNLPPEDGFGTICASVVALSADGRRIWRFCPAPPGRAAFFPLDA